MAQDGGPIYSETDPGHDGATANTARAAAARNHLHAGGFRRLPEAVWLITLGPLAVSGDPAM